MQNSVLLSHHSAIAAGCRGSPGSDGLGCRCGGAIGTRRDGVSRHHLAQLVRSLDRPAADHAVRRALCHPRCAGTSISGAQDGPEPCRVVAGERGRQILRVQAAPGPEIPQRRRRDDGGRQVQLRALQGRVGKDPARQCRQHRDRRSAGGALSSQGAVARLHDDLRHHRQRRRHRRAEEISHTGRGGRLQEAPDRRRPLQIRQPEAGLGGRARGLHRLLAPRAQRQDPDIEERAGGDHAGRDGEDRRGRHRLRARRARGRGDPERSAHAGRLLQARLDLLDRVHGAVGRQVAVARQAAAAGGQPGARPQADQRGGVPGLLPAGRV